jgi:hypothetical protein
MISPAALEQQLARAVGTIRERLGDNPDVVWLAEAIERGVVVVRKVPSQKKRGGKSEHWAAELERRNSQRLRPLHAKHYATLSPGAAAKQMSEEFETYETDRWPRERDKVVAPLREPQRTFWMILRDHAAGGPRMPNVRQLATILGRQGG